MTPDLVKIQLSWLNQKKKKKRKKRKVLDNDMLNLKIKPEDITNIQCFTAIKCKPFYITKQCVILRIKERKKNDINRPFNSITNTARDLWLGPFWSSWLEENNSDEAALNMRNDIYVYVGPESVFLTTIQTFSGPLGLQSIFD